ncbi:MAG: glycosyltransferase family 1 protein [Chloroflexota bacterium]
MPLTIGFDATAAARQAAGIGRYTRHLLAALAQRNDPFRYQAYFCAGGDVQGFIPSLDERFHVRALPVSDRLLNLVLHRARIPIPAQILAGRFDLFHSPDFTLPLTGGRPSLVTIHDLAFLRVPDCAYPTLRLYLERVVPRAAARASKIIAVSENTRRDILDLFAVPDDKVVTIAEGVDRYFHPVGDRTEVASHVRRLGIAEPFLLAVGTLEPRKNYVRLLEAFRRIIDRGAAHTLVIAGSPGWLYEPVYRRLRELRLETRVRFLQPRDRDLLALYNMADAFVYASLYEGFGLPPLEAMACGTPVACSNVSSLPEVVGEAAVMFDPEDVDHMSDVLLKVIGDASLRESLRERGLHRARAFSWDDAARQTAELYTRMAADA